MKIPTMDGERNNEDDLGIVNNNNNNNGNRVAGAPAGTLLQVRRVSPQQIHAESRNFGSASEGYDSRSVSGSTPPASNLKATPSVPAATCFTSDAQLQSQFLEYNQLHPLPGSSHHAQQQISSPVGSAVNPNTISSLPTTALTIPTGQSENVRLNLQQGNVDTGVTRNSDSVSYNRFSSGGNSRPGGQVIEASGSNRPIVVRSEENYERAENGGQTVPYGYSSSQQGGPHHVGGGGPQINLVGNFRLSSNVSGGGASSENFTQRSLGYGAIRNSQPYDSAVPSMFGPVGDRDDIVRLGPSSSSCNYQPGYHISSYTVRPVKVQGSRPISVSQGSGGAGGNYGTSHVIIRTSSNYNNAPNFSHQKVMIRASPQQQLGNAVNSYGIQYMENTFNQRRDSSNAQYYVGQRGYSGNSSGSNTVTGESISSSNNSTYSFGGVSTPNYQHNGPGGSNLGNIVSQPTGSNPLVCRVNPIPVGSRFSVSSQNSSHSFGLHRPHHMQPHYRPHVPYPPGSSSAQFSGYAPTSMYNAHPPTSAAGAYDSRMFLKESGHLAAGGDGGEWQFLLTPGARKDCYSKPFLMDSGFFDAGSLMTPITLQALPGLPSGAQVPHLLVKTENGQLQLVRVPLSLQAQPPQAPSGGAVATGTANPQPVLPSALNPGTQPTAHGPQGVITAGLNNGGLVNSPAAPASVTANGPNSILPTPNSTPVLNQSNLNGNPQLVPTTITTLTTNSLQQQLPQLGGGGGGAVAPTATGIPNVNMTTNPGGTIRNPAVIGITMVTRPNSPRLMTPIHSNAISASNVSSTSAVCSTANQTPGVAPAANSPIGTTTYRLQTVPQTVGTTTQNLLGMHAVRMPQQYIQSHQHPLNSAAHQMSASGIQSNTVSQMNAETAKTKCKNFLTFLLELSAKQSQAVARNVKNLIQGLVDGKVTAEDFSEKLQKEVNSQPQPCLVGFLKKSLPHLRHSLAHGEVRIEGIRPPNLASVGTIPTPVSLVSRPVRPQVPVTIPVASPQVVSPAAPRPIVNAVQQRLTTPTKSANANRGGTAKGASTSSSPAGGSAASRLSAAKAGAKDKDKKGSGGSFGGGDDDINDVAAMGGVNLAEETQKILGSTEFVGTTIRSVKDETFLSTILLQGRIKAAAAKFGIEEVSPEVMSMVSHATEERLKNLLEKLSVIAEHRMDVIKADDRYEVSQDVRGQLRFLEELDKLERKRHDEQEREILIKAAKSRSKSEDPEQAKLKAKAKEMQRAALEEMRQEEANRTALQAIGPRKKPKLDNLSGPTNSAIQSSLSGPGIGSSLSRPAIGMRPRLKRVNLRDLLFLLEQDKETQRCHFLYKNFLLK